ncbi:hypothetical protein [Jannaschia pohangensis]|uniref:Protease inhibitor Inh n=1 Tax=Jannaschia pohangensis TaxID=390807 RepID=A0A1I3IQP7_9RHOB|nr:hypothetical protein [Jannaschia pohangensis]SFI50177.1 hypothetical protein SAMN04488095_1061 [Jannaschia pohangensis]
MFTPLKSVAAFVALSLLVAPLQSQAQQTTTTAIGLSNVFEQYTKRYPHVVDVKNMQTYLGDWECTLDGRGASLRIIQPAEKRTTCQVDQPNVCSISVRYHTPKIFFRDHGWDGSGANGPSVQMMNVSPGYTGATLRHPDGNEWHFGGRDFITTPTHQITLANRLEGNSTWRGRQYPLSCDRVWAPGTRLY